MKKLELQKITKKLGDLEQKLEYDYGLSGENCGFVAIDMIDFDEDKIYIEVESGIMGGRTTTEELELDRDTLKFIN